MRQLPPEFAPSREYQVRPKSKARPSARSHRGSDALAWIVHRFHVARTPNRCSVLTTAVAALAAFVVASAAPAAAQGQAAQEYEIKAAFLYNFTKFVEWPPEAFPDDSAPIVIAVLGPDPFGSALDEIVAGKHAGGRPLMVRRFETSSDLTACHVVFVSSRSADEFSRRVQTPARRYMLTVGETDGFAETGGVVQFVTDERKVRFRINPTAANKAGLKISSRLLNLAEVVGQLPNGAHN